MSALQRWRDRCDPEVLPVIDALREIVAAANAGLTESIKWNAPNFAHHGDDRITLGIERKGGARIVFHRGAPKKSDGFSFPDRDGLATWLSPDRGVIKFRSLAELEAKRQQLVALIGRWLEATA